MHVNDVDNLVPTLPQVPNLRTPPTPKPQRCPWPVDWLENFETLDSQLSAFGLTFERAIAFRPSNPRFYPGSDNLVIMPDHQSRFLRISVSKSTSQINLWVMGSQVITASALSARGRCVKTVRTSEPEIDDATQVYPQQLISLDTRYIKTIRIESKAPFILARCMLR